MPAGLTTPAQKAAAHKWVDEKINQALHDVKNAPKLKDFPTRAAFDAKVAEIKRNPFLEEVAKIKEHADADPDPSKRENKLNTGIATLKADSKAALEKGKELPDFFDILGKAFSSFDITDPFGSIKRIITGSIKAFAFAIGGDMAAPWLRSMKSNFTGDRKLSTEEAAQLLAFENGAEKLAEFLGKDPKHVQAFADGIGKQIDALARRSSGASTGGAGQTTAAAKLAAMPDVKAEKLFSSDAVPANIKAALPGIETLATDPNGKILVVSHEGKIGVYVGQEKEGKFVVKKMLQPGANGTLVEVKPAPNIINYVPGGQDITFAVKNNGVIENLTPFQADVGRKRDGEGRVDLNEPEKKALAEAANAVIAQALDSIPVAGAFLKKAIQPATSR